MKRRTFLATSGRTLAGSGVLMSMPAALATWATACTNLENEGGFLVLTDEEAADLEAIASCILPSDDTPGAREAGVIHFIDAALGGMEAESLGPVRAGLAELLADVERTEGRTSFAGLPADRQIAALERIEESDFFGTVRYLTLAGMFSDRSYGGNRDGIGWELIGFDDQGAAPPPFGWYDADYVEKGS
jgi:gluconate 2-dehydrogenase gamma chain